MNACTDTTRTPVLTWRVPAGAGRHLVFTILAGAWHWRVDDAGATTWHDITASHPAAEIEVLVAIEGEDQPTEAYLCDALDDGSPVFAYINSGLLVRGNVYAWAPLPAVPGVSFFKSAKGGA